VSGAEQQRAREQLAAWFRKAADAGMTLETVVGLGDPAATILAQAALLSADLIVLGTHGSSGVERFMVGSVTEKVLRKAPCPVLTVPPHAQATSRLPFTRILCAVDFSDWSEAALMLGSSLADQSGAALSVMHVIEWPWHEPPAPAFSDMLPEQASALAEYRRYVETTATKRLETIVSTTRPHGHTAVRVCHGKPYVEVLRVASEEKADIIVLGVHGRNPIDLALFGSTANHVVRQATCPVLTLRR
jgi:nucleotide-binding universal stress UspA family protein